MTTCLKRFFERLRRDERGVTLVEYGIAIALAVALGTAALSTLGTEIGDAMTAAGNEMPDPGT
ncbi:Flp family type IVb pilin [Parasedimentitalea marina]|uniref:Flp family type IVb pilin n=1 Tax=Parasedimentitalea marina TaxID=2483033 RepID=A0A3T0N1Z9_9RHOB|nr:Flp family type IVb pilin [Parasedimentitalea marina]AZV78019.1 Flp family type IVb pilin [Parasedimentitalea marina]